MVSSSSTHSRSSSSMRRRLWKFGGSSTRSEEVSSFSVGVGDGAVAAAATAATTLTTRENSQSVSSQNPIPLLPPRSNKSFVRKQQRQQQRQPQQPPPIDDIINDLHGSSERTELAASRGAGDQVSTSSSHIPGGIEMVLSLPASSIGGSGDQSSQSSQLPTTTSTATDSQGSTRITGGIELMLSLSPAVSCGDDTGAPSYHQYSQPKMNTSSSTTTGSQGAASKASSTRTHQSSLASSTLSAPPTLLELGAVLDTFYRKGWVAGMTADRHDLRAITKFQAKLREPDLLLASYTHQYGPLAREEASSWGSDEESRTLLGASTVGSESFATYPSQSTTKTDGRTTVRSASSDNNTYDESTYYYRQGHNDGGAGTSTWDTYEGRTSSYDNSILYDDDEAENGTRFTIENEKEDPQHFQQQHQQQPLRRNANKNFVITDYTGPSFPSSSSTQLADQNQELELEPPTPRNRKSFSATKFLLRKKHHRQQTEKIQLYREQNKINPNRTIMVPLSPRNAPYPETWKQQLGSMLSPRRRKRGSNPKPPLPPPPVPNISIIPEKILFDFNITTSSTNSRDCDDTVPLSLPPTNTIKSEPEIIVFDLSNANNNTKNELHTDGIHIPPPAPNEPDLPPTWSPEVADCDETLVEDDDLVSVVSGEDFRFDSHRQCEHNRAGRPPIQVPRTVPLPPKSALGSSRTTTNERNSVGSPFSTKWETVVKETTNSMRSMTRSLFLSPPSDGNQQNKETSSDDDHNNDDQESPQSVDHDTKAKHDPATHDENNTVDNSNMAASTTEQTALTRRTSRNTTTVMAAEASLAQEARSVASTNLHLRSRIKEHVFPSSRHILPYCSPAGIDGNLIDCESEKNMILQSYPGLMKSIVSNYDDDEDDDSGIVDEEEDRDDVPSQTDYNIHDRNGLSERTEPFGITTSRQGKDQPPAEAELLPLAPRIQDGIEMVLSIPEHNTNSNNECVTSPSSSHWSRIGDELEIVYSGDNTKYTDNTNSNSCTNNCEEHKVDHNNKYGNNIKSDTATTDKTDSSNDSTFQNQSSGSLRGMRSKSVQISRSLRGVRSSSVQFLVNRSKKKKDRQQQEKKSVCATIPLTAGAE